MAAAVCLLAAEAAHQARSEQADGPEARWLEPLRCRFAGAGEGGPPGAGLWELLAGLRAAPAHHPETRLAIMG